MTAAELRHVLDLAGQRRRGTNIHRRHLLGHEPTWPTARSGVSDVSRHTPVSDVLRLHIALSVTEHAEIAAIRSQAWEFPKFRPTRRHASCKPVPASWRSVPRRHFCAGTAGASTAH